MLNSEIATSVMPGTSSSSSFDNRGYGCINRLQEAVGAPFNPVRRLRERRVATQHLCRTCAAMVRSAKRADPRAGSRAATGAGRWIHLCRHIETDPALAPPTKAVVGGRWQSPGPDRAEVQAPRARAGGKEKQSP
jgi:TPP-dependent trihydroxycyclohexane-1,2-dione (THcHDO) dehydratase